MSMDFSEFQRRLGADPRGSDPALRAAREAGPDFEAAAAAAEQFEQKLERAVCISTPAGLIDGLQQISAQPRRGLLSRRWGLALAASLIMGLGAVGLLWNAALSPASVEEYVADHYRHDGDPMMERAGVAGRGGNGSAKEARVLLAEFDLRMADELAAIISVVKSCPTPDGRGIHMVLNTADGPMTVIYMPGTSVTDRQMLRFDGMQAMLVQLESGSAAIIGRIGQPLAALYPLVDRGFLPNGDRS